MRARRARTGTIAAVSETEVSVREEAARRILTPAAPTPRTTGAAAPHHPPAMTAVTEIAEDTMAEIATTETDTMAGAVGVMEETEREAGASQTTSLRGSGMEAGTEVSPVEVIVTGTETEDGTVVSHEETGMETEMIGGKKEKLRRKGQNSIWHQEVNQ